jgi:putative ABC transport system permease protein
MFWKTVLSPFVAEFFLSGAKNLLANRLRSGLTVSGIALGAAATVFLYGLNLNFTGYTLGHLEKMGGNIITVTFPSSPGFSNDYFQSSLRPLAPFIEASAPFAQSHYCFEEGALKIPATLMGVDEAYFKLKGLGAAGFLNFPRWGLVNKKLWQDSGGRFHPAYTVRLGNLIFEIHQIASEKVTGIFEPRPVFYLSRKELLGLSLPVTQGWYLKIKPGFVSQVEELLQKIWTAESGVEIFSFSAAREMVFDFRRIAGELIFFVTLLTVLVGGLGVANVMLINITEKTYEYGILLAIGLQPKQLFFEVLAQSLWLCGAGVLAGAAAGLLLDFAVSLFAGLKIIFPVFAVVLVLGAGFFFGLVFGFYPAVRAAGLEPVEAIRGL